METIGTSSTSTGEVPSTDHKQRSTTRTRSSGGRHSPDGTRSTHKESQIVGLYWIKPDRTYSLVDEVVKYHPLNMVTVLIAGSRFLIPAENLWVR